MQFDYNLKKKTKNTSFVIRSNKNYCRYASSAKQKKNCKVFQILPERLQQSTEQSNARPKPAADSRKPQKTAAKPKIHKFGYEWRKN